NISFTQSFLDYVGPNLWAVTSTFDNGVRLVDVNGDHLPDIVISQPHVDQYNIIYPRIGRCEVLLNTGTPSSGWVHSTSLTTGLCNIPPFNFVGAQFVDVNGDNLR